MKTSRVLLLFPILGLLLLCGCLEFEKQTLTYRYDATTDTLKIYQCYQGIYGQADKARLNEEELRQLQSVLTGQRTFFFANWAFEYSRDGINDWLEQLKQPQTGDGPKDSPEMIAHLESFLKLVLANVTVVNGSLYYGADGKLCGVQQVTAKQWSKILAAANACIRDAYIREAPKTETSTAFRELIQKTTASPRTYLRMEGNQLQARIPMPPAEYQDSFKDEVDVKRLVDLVKPGGGKFTYASNEVTLLIGTPKAQTVRLAMPVFTNTYSTNVVAELQKQNISILPKFDADAAATAFLK